MRPRPRSRLVPIIVLTAVAVGVLWVIVSLSVGEGDPGTIPVEGAGETQELIGGIEQSFDRLGPVDAPVQLTIFNDVQCSVCATFEREVVTPLIADYARTGEAALELRNFSIGPKAVTLGAIATEAAAAQDRKWQYAHLFLINLDKAPEAGIDDEYLNAVAAATPKLDTAAWEEALADPATAERVEADAERASEQRFPAEPVVLVDGPGGSEQLEDPSYEEVEAAIGSVG